MAKLCPRSCWMPPYRIKYCLNFNTFIFHKCIDYIGGSAVTILKQKKSSLIYLSNTASPIWFHPHFYQEEKKFKIIWFHWLIFPKSWYWSLCDWLLTIYILNYLKKISFYAPNFQITKKCNLQISGTAP